MPPLPSLLAALCGWACLAAPVMLAQAATDPLAGYRGRARVLLVSAPTAADPTLARQRAAFAAMRAGARDRDLVLLEAIGLTDAALALRAPFALDPATFTAVLIGKDGGAKLRAPTVLGPEQLFPTIDAMPMRQDELRRRIDRRRVP